LIYSLQHVIGNQAVQHPLAQAEDARFRYDFSRIPIHTSPREGLQSPLTVNTPGDMHEQEAERLAQQVIGRSEEYRAPRAHSAAVVGQLEVTPGGSPLPGPERAFFEPRFGHDFGRVRVHADAGAHAMAARLHAQAFTVGGNVYFAAGKYAPSMSDGRRLLAHELAHVVQQSRGAVSPGLVQRTEDWNFTPADFGELKKNKGALKFGPDSSWFPGPFQSNLMDTLNLVLDPTRKKPATQGVNTTDFFHGHIATKSKKSDELQKFTGEYNKVGEAEYSKALGGSRANDLTTKNLPAYRAAVEKTLPSAQSMLEAAAKLKDVVVIYHTFETNKPAEMKYGSPERNFITPLGGSPKGYSPRRFLGERVHGHLSIQFPHR